MFKEKEERPVRKGRSGVRGKYLAGMLAAVMVFLTGSATGIYGADPVETVTIAEDESGLSAVAGEESGIPAISEAESGVAATAEDGEETEGEAPSEEGGEASAPSGNAALSEGGVFEDTDSSEQSGSGDTEVPDAVFETEVPQAGRDDSVPDEDSENKDPEISPEENAPEDMVVPGETTEEEDETEGEFLLQAAGSTGGEITGTTGRNGTVLTWSLKDHVLTVSGQGPMDDFFKTIDMSTNQVMEYAAPWKEHSFQIEEVVIAQGVTSVGNYSFNNLYNLEKVTIAGSVKKIGDGAFSNDQRITEINLAEGTEMFGSNAFYFANVTELKLPRTLRKLEINALGGMYSLKNYRMDGSGVYCVIDGVLYTDGGGTIASFPEGRTGSFTVPGSVRKIASDAFIYTNITGIQFPNSLEEIGARAFSWSAVEEVTIPGSVRSISGGAFSDGRGLRKVVIKEGVKEIENFAFENNSLLTEVSLPQSLEKIGSCVFNSTAISTIRIPASVTSIGQQALNGIENVVLEGNRLIKLEDGSYILGATLDVTAFEDYDGAYKILELTNQERAKAGMAPLTMERSLLESAMHRGFETILLFSHDRPNGLDCFSANSLMRGENIAVNLSSEAAFRAWMASAGHKNNILNKEFKSIGVGCVRYGEIYFCVQCFGTKTPSPASRAGYGNGNRTRKVIYDQTRYPNLKNALTKGKHSDGTGNTNSGLISYLYDNGNTNGWSMDGPETEEITISKIPSSVKAKAAKKGKVTVRWKKLKKTKKNKALWNQISGIEIQYSTDSSFRTNVVTRTVGKKKAKLQIKGLNRNTTYYVRIRYTDGYGGYSGWSKARTVKTKK